ncbi:hypothetical protein [Corynebacterium kozikiae]|uniref:hypothetical protein n=1 Tax=Corynebacterium kozikiae TaxID=2968469 RepID=UPI00211BDC54|nr:hypothetical protein [Corynebacterium sp. 76QC2CO]MCQ9344005.1 hypothetical protein [Corynebacterium sp. 76QC2CO]
MSIHNFLGCAVVDARLIRLGLRFADRLRLRFDFFGGKSTGISRAELLAVSPTDIEPPQRYTSKKEQGRNQKEHGFSLTAQAAELEHLEKYEETRGTPPKKGRGLIDSEVNSNQFLLGSMGKFPSMKGQHNATWLHKGFRNHAVGKCGFPCLLPIRARGTSHQFGGANPNGI